MSLLLRSHLLQPIGSSQITQAAFYFYLTIKALASFLAGESLNDFANIGPWFCFYQAAHVPRCTACP